MAHVHGFPPIEAAGSRVLILGSMPGKASLRARQYYAHPRNAFWRILAEVLGFDAENTYDGRVASLLASDIALWDVLKLCTRRSSLDSDIEHDTIVVNDFAGFFASHRKVRKVFFNGSVAEAIYLKHVRPLLPADSDFEYVRLPSTSPANAAISFAQKLQAWRVVTGAS